MRCRSINESAFLQDLEITGDSLGNPPRTTIADEPLRLAIKNSHVDCAELLLKCGADPNARYFLGSELNMVSPLNITFLEMLLRFGADPDNRDRAGLTPLMKACRHPQGYAAAKMLISYGADVNAMTTERHDHRTVLHYAVLSGNVGIVNMLLSYGANVRFPAEFQKPTPIDFAILRSNVEMVKLLLDAGADVNAGSPIIGLPLHIALSEKVILCHKLTQCIDLVLLCSQVQIGNRFSITSLLLDRGADPNAITTDERGPLLKPPLGEFLNSVDDPEPEIIELLLRYGARVILKVCSLFQATKHDVNIIPHSAVAGARSSGDSEIYVQIESGQRSIRHHGERGRKLQPGRHQTVHAPEFDPAPEAAGTGFDTDFTEAAVTHTDTQSAGRIWAFFAGENCRPADSQPDATVPFVLSLLTQSVRYKYTCSIMSLRNAACRVKFISKINFIQQWMVN